MKKIFIGSILLVLLSSVVIGLGKAFSHVNRKIVLEYGTVKCNVHGGK